jgi:hypothetical protein
MEGRKMTSSKMTSSERLLMQAQAVGRADALAGRPSNPPFTRHLKQAYELAYSAAKHGA